MWPLLSVGFCHCTRFLEGCPLVIGELAVEGRYAGIAGMAAGRMLEFCDPVCIFQGPQRAGCPADTRAGGGTPISRIWKPSNHGHSVAPFALLGAAAISRAFSTACCSGMAARRLCSWYGHQQALLRYIGQRNDLPK